MRIPSIWTIPVGQSKPGVFVGCVRQYCYCHEKKYCPFEDPHDFAYRIEVKENALDLAARYRQLYPPGSYGPTRSDWRPVALPLKELCAQYGIRDRMPRPIIPGDKRTLYPSTSSGHRFGRVTHVVEVDAGVELANGGCSVRIDRSTQQIGASAIAGLNLCACECLTKLQPFIQGCPGEVAR